MHLDKTPSFSGDFTLKGLKMRSNMPVTPATKVQSRGNCSFHKFFFLYQILAFAAPSSSYPRCGSCAKHNSYTLGEVIINLNSVCRQAQTAGASFAQSLHEGLRDQRKRFGRVRRAALYEYVCHQGSLLAPSEVEPALQAYFADARA